MAQISILLAAYNAEKHIAQALESAVAQTQRNIEIICVDDCSTDATLAIMREYALRDARVKVLCHENERGLFETRRTGVNAAEGEYVLFLDADDFLSADACERSYAAVCESPADILQFGMEVFAEEYAGVSEEELEKYRRQMLPCKEQLPQKKYAPLQACFVEKRFDSTLCGKLFPLAAVQQAWRTLPPTRLTVAESAMSFFVLCEQAVTYRALPQPLYHFRVGDGLTTQRRELLSTEQIDAYADAYRAYTVLREKYGQSPPEQIDLPLVKMREALVNEILQAFFFRTHAVNKQKFMERMSECYPLPAFLEDVVRACTDPAFHLSLSRAVGQLRGLPCKPRLPIKTVGTYYTRIHNGGIERVLSLLMPIWLAAGYQVVLFTEQPSHPDEYDVPDAVRRVVVGQIDDPVQRFCTWQRLLMENRVDIMVYHAWVNPNIVVDSLAFKAMGLPLVMHTHGQACCLFGQCKVERMSQRSEYALSDVVIALSETDTAWWSALGFRSMHAMNPLTYDARRVPQAKLGSKKVLWVGRLATEKQFGDALSIARMVRDRVPDFRLQVIGGCENDKEWRAVVKEVADRGLQDTILLEGYQSDVAPYYENACAMLGTSEQEGCCMSHNEAHAFGLPLVVYELPNSDLLRKGRGVVVVPQADRYAAAEQLVKLLTDDDYRRKLGNEARAGALEMSKVDLQSFWNDVFAAAVQPTKPFEALLSRSPADTIVCMTMERLSSDTIQNGLVVGLENAQRECAQYAVAMEELTNSTIFRVGKLVTWPLRKLKSLLGGWR